MRARTALGAPLALSLAGHAALLALVAGAGVLAGPRTRPQTERVIPVQRAPERGAASGQRLVLEVGAAGTGPALAADETATVALDTADPRYRPYLSGVRRRIWERWGDPDLAAGQPARGTLVVEFTLNRRGGVAAAAVREPSGIPALDAAALAAVARAAPFTPLPASIAGATLRVRARFVYD